MREIVREHVDLYLDEYVEMMQMRTGKYVSVPTLWRSLAYSGITRKKVQIFIILMCTKINKLIIILLVT